MSEAIRITPEEARASILAGKALLICAYEDEAHFTKYHLEGAVTLSSFKARVGELPREQELIFY